VTPPIRTEFVARINVNIHAVKAAKPDTMLLYPVATVW
jgi:hypothetical protein